MKNPIYQFSQPAVSNPSEPVLDSKGTSGRVGSLLQSQIDSSVVNLVKIIFLCKKKKASKHFFKCFYVL